VLQFSVAAGWDLVRQVWRGFRWGFGRSALVEMLGFSSWLEERDLALGRLDSREVNERRAVDIGIAVGVFLCSNQWKLRCGITWGTEYVTLHAVLFYGI
jgi:hypothetical protein